LINPVYGMTYVGLRTTNLWENNYENNPPLVAFHTPLTDILDWKFVPRKLFAWWLLKDGLGQIRQTPFLSFNSELVGRAYGPSQHWAFNFITMGSQDLSYHTSEASAISRITGDPFGGPLFKIKGMGGLYSYFDWTTPWNAPFTAFYAWGPSQGTHYFPIVDPNTGILVPPAYPINMMLNVVSETTSLCYFNQGGRLPGIYRSLAGTDEFLNRYYVPGQNFIVDSENYYPYVTGSNALYRDMFLIRRY
jgi:hypothetical protein